MGGLRPLILGDRRDLRTKVTDSLAMAPLVMATLILLYWLIRPFSWGFWGRIVRWEFGS